MMKVILLHGYQEIFEDPLFIKQIKQQTFSNQLSPALSSLLELYHYLLEVFSSHYQTNKVSLSVSSSSLSSTSSLPNDSSVVDLSYQQIDLDILRLSSIQSVGTTSLSIPIIPTLLDSLSSIIVTFDDIYSENFMIEKQSRELIRQTMLEKEIEDICLQILIANKRRTIEVESSEKLYWNDVIKSCLNLLMNLSFHCVTAQVILYFHYIFYTTLLLKSLFIGLYSRKRWFTTYFIILCDRF